MSKEALLNQADVSLLIGVSAGTIGEDFKRPSENVRLVQFGCAILCHLSKSAFRSHRKACTCMIFRPQMSLDIRDSLPISHLVRNPVKKQMNMMENSLLWELPSRAIKPEEKTR